MVGNDKGNAGGSFNGRRPQHCWWGGIDSKQAIVDVPYLELIMVQDSDAMPSNHYCIWYFFSFLLQLLCRPLPSGSLSRLSSSSSPKNQQLSIDIPL